jgi:hypothetical protein
MDVLGVCHYVNAWMCLSLAPAILSGSPPTG